MWQRLHHTLLAATHRRSAVDTCHRPARRPGGRILVGRHTIPTILEVHERALERGLLMLQTIRAHTQGGVLPPSSVW
jgi:hypothetical protein